MYSISYTNRYPLKETHIICQKQKIRIWGVAQFFSLKLIIFNQSSCTILQFNEQSSCIHHVVYKNTIVNINKQINMCYSDLYNK